MILDYDVIIVGGGPAGLTAGIYLARGKRRVLILSKEAFGGWVKNIEWIENYPGFSEGVSGPKLASEMVNQAIRWGAQLEQREVLEIDSFSTCKSINCADRKGYTCDVVIIAGGCRSRKLGVPGEDKFQNKGIIQCATCDGVRFSGRVVAVCGGGDAGISEAIYLTNLASKVILIESQPSLTGTAILQERAHANSKLEIRCGEQVVEISGDDRVQAIHMMNVASGVRQIVHVDGVLIHVGIEPLTGYLRGFLTLDEQGQILVDDRLETTVPGVLAAGDIRCGSVRQVAAAIGDGAIAAIVAEKLLSTGKRSLSRC